MPNPKLMAVITALIMITGSSGLRAEYSLAQLQELERLILGKNCGNLWDYLQKNPEIMAGNDALARELQVFVQSTQNGLLSCFAARTATIAPTPLAPTAPSFVANLSAAY